MSTYLTAYKSYMNREGIKFVERDEWSVDVAYGDSNIQSIKVVIRFDENDDGHVHFVTYAIGAFSGKEAEGMRVCNEMNKRFRWAKFYVDNESDIAVNADAITNLDSVGQVCTEIVERVVSITNDAYPEFMKVRWNN